MLCQPSVAYDDSGWKQGQHGNYQVERKASFIDLRNRLFLTGFLSRIEQFCKLKGWRVSYSDESFVDYDLPLQVINPTLPNIEFRPDQIEIINNAVGEQRGLIIAPTGSGKSILMCGIISSYPDTKWLLLAHTKSLVKQLSSDTKKFDLSDRVTVSTRQTWVKKNPAEWADYFDGVVIDEIHQGSSGGDYKKILTKMLAPLRYGFTATLPQDQYGRLLIEGLLGPVVGRQTIEEARSLQILAEPKLELISVPKSKTVAALKTYKLIYKEGVVDNKVRARLTLNKVKELVNRGLTSIVFVQELEHMDNLVWMAATLGIPVSWVQGSTPQDERERIKRDLQSKRISCVISSTVWREGINIPSLGAVILASGLKSEVATLQSVGRALRRTSDKDQAVIVDFLDPYKYLAEHTVNRLKTYHSQGWIG